MSSHPTQPVKWPGSALDPVRRLRVLAASLPGCAIVEQVFDAPFELAWGFLSDLERSVPEFDTEVARLVIHDRRDDQGQVRLSATAWARPWLPGLPLDVALEEGFCWMAAPRRTFVVGMAAVPDGRRTRYAHLEGTALRLPGLAQAVARRQRGQVLRDMAGIRSALRQRG